MLIHGDNAQILDLLEKTHAGKVKCVYLDPPYNNGEKYRHYSDRMDRNKWLSSVCEILRKTKTLLRDDGSVWISIDDSELHYLKVASDSIFGRDHFAGTIVWEHRTTRENRSLFSKNHEYILVYAKNRTVWKETRHLMPITKEVQKRYGNPDDDPRGAWQSVSATVQAGHASMVSQYYPIMSPNGRIHYPPKGRCWIYSKPKFEEERKKKNIWFGKDHNGVPRLKKFLGEMRSGLTPETLWLAEQAGTTTQAKKHLMKMFGQIPSFDTPKPEQLIKRILDISTDPGDIVLDPYMGSGTTVAVAHKMKRSYIGIEMGEHIRSHCCERLKKVIDGESGGISHAEGWINGGGFDFYEA